MSSWPSWLLTFSLAHYFPFPLFLPSELCVAVPSSLIVFHLLSHSLLLSWFPKRGKRSQWYVSDLPTKEPQRGHNARGHMITGQTHKKSIKPGGLSAVLLSSWQVLQTEDHGVVRLKTTQNPESHSGVTHLNMTLSGPSGHWKKSFLWGKQFLDRNFFLS